MTEKVAALGECMVELIGKPDGTAVTGFGGDTLNTAVYMARLGVGVDYVTALGDDPLSDAMISAWEAEGVGTGRVLRVAGRLPGRYTIETDAAGERRFVYRRESSPARDLFVLPGSEALARDLEDCELLYLSGISLAIWGERGRERFFDLADRVRSRGGRIAFDSNWRPGLWPDRETARAAYGEVLRRTDIAFPGQGDERDLFGDDTPHAILDRLGEAGVAEIVVKLDRPGCLISTGGALTCAFAEPAAKVVDTTAAGDSFSAGYLAARLRGCDPAEAARAGQHLAAAVIEHHGAIIPRSAMPMALRRFA